MKTSRSAQRTLLIIDDDRLFCDAVEGHFSGDRIDVISAFTGADGLSVCAMSKVDLVLLDQKLPDGKGVDLCKPILALNDDTKIIFITAYPSFDNAVSAIKLGAFDYLSKPFELEELEQGLNSHRLKKLPRLLSNRVEAFHGVIDHVHLVQNHNDLLQPQ